MSATTALSRLSSFAWTMARTAAGAYNLLFVASSVGVQVAAARFASGFDGNYGAWYAFTVFQFPYGVFVVSIATALMPKLSKRFAGATWTATALRSPSA